ncbi:DUF1566 domain-containing protein [Patescibacteria group bacterium]|nr:DUF1566 domain-containing protein [Patescibacteria group bacterium]MBU1449022.1 DUF1566 domain-containing protein [Patescibacteria group bacterium]MBU2613668.1 DUF1566 domain-containing protein [Patescibacteria group bacterium]
MVKHQRVQQDTRTDKTEGKERQMNLFGVLAKGGLTVLISVLMIYGVVQAGTITPPTGGGEPSAKFYTLSEIYEFITNDTAATEGGHDFTFSDAATGTGRTLTEIYDALAGLISDDKVRLGTTYLNVDGMLTPDGGTAVVADVFSGKTANLTADWVLDAGTLNLACNVATFDAVGNLVGNGYDGDGNGSNRWCMTDSGNASAASIASSSVAWVDGVAITGTLLGNMWNGTKGIYIGGSQLNGGVDDYNAGAAAPSDRYAGSWTACVVGNNYCDTGDDGADARDDSTGLVWSMPCNGAGCDSLSDAAPVMYAWTTTTTANNFSDIQGRYLDVGTSTALGVCQGGDHGKSGWLAPTQKQLMQASIDGSYGNLEGTGVNRYYWSSTTVSHSLTSAWLTNLSNGYTVGNAKINAFYVRCVR